MARTTLTYDFDEINQQEVFTFASGDTVPVSEATFRQLHGALAQVKDRRSEYLGAWQCGCDGPFSDEPCDYHEHYHPHVEDEPLLYTPLYRALQTALDETPERKRANARRQKRDEWVERLGQDERWVTQSGRVIDLTSDLADLPLAARADRVRHLRNIMGWLETRERAFATMVLDQLVGAPADAWAMTERDVSQPGWITTTKLYRRMAEVVDEASPALQAAGDVVQATRKVRRRVTGRWPN